MFPELKQNQHGVCLFVMMSSMRDMFSFVFYVKMTLSKGENNMANNIKRRKFLKISRNKVSAENSFLNNPQ